MPRPKVIDSRQNRRFLQWQEYVRNPAQAACPWLAVEGWKAVGDLAVQRPIELLLFSRPEHPDLAGIRSRSRESVQIADSLMRRLSGVQVPQGVLAFFQKPVWKKSDLTDCIVYLDGLQDPGNLGTLIRTAAAAGGFSLVSAPETVSFYNDKIVRASAGLLFRVPFVQHLELDRLARSEWTVWLASPEAGESFQEACLTPPLILLVGREGTGSRQPVAAGVRRIRIPMQPGIDSLNAAVAGSLLMYEVVRRHEQNTVSH